MTCMCVLAPSMNQPSPLSMAEPPIERFLFARPRPNVLSVSVEMRAQGRSGVAAPRARPGIATPWTLLAIGVALRAWMLLFGQATPW